MDNDILEKPAIVKSMLIKKLLICGVLFLAGLGLMIFSISECVRFREVRRHAAKVEAVVCRVNEGSDADGNDEYYVYVNYDFQGSNYTKHHITSTKANCLNLVGETLTITINSDKPTEEINEIKDVIFFSMFFGLPVFAFGVSCSAKLKHRLSWVEMYGLRDSAIRKDLHAAQKESNRLRWLFIVGVGFLVFGVYILDIDSVGAGAIVMGLMLLGLYILLRCFANMSGKHGINEEYISVKGTVKEKRCELDSDNDRHYSFLFVNDVGSKWFATSKQKYNMLEKGMEIVYVTQGGVVLGYMYDKESGDYWCLQ